MQAGKSSIQFEHPPIITSAASIVGQTEGEGALAIFFDRVEPDPTFGKKSWEEAESELQRQTVQKCLDKAGRQAADVNCLFAGDLLGQIVATSFGVESFDIPFFGLYGACSTMGEAMILGAMAAGAGYADRVLALASSHFASAERQFRFPLEYGSIRPPTAQWTVTGAGAVILGGEGKGPCLERATIGTIVDAGIKDANNMGAAMAPAAFETLRAHFDDFHCAPEEYDLIVTGDLGKLGSELVRELFSREGVRLGSRYQDCGVLIFDAESQDVHCGGSGCGCSASVLCGDLLGRMRQGKLRKLLFCGTGALLSPLSTQQGESIPAVCHAVSISAERS